jgi:hypothetical protein
LLFLTYNIFSLLMRNTRGIEEVRCVITDIEDAEKAAYMTLERFGYTSM